MKRAWPKFPVDDLDAYERRHRLNARLAAVAFFFFAPAWMFGDETVHVPVGIIALVIAAIVGLVMGTVMNHRRPDLPYRALPPTWTLALYVAAVGVGLVLEALGNSLGWGHETFTVSLSAAWMGSAVFGFLRAPAVARYRRRRYEADLAEVAEGPRPSRA